MMIPIVLSGGSGTRLWPVSRASFPKQFVALLDESLLRKTLSRLMPLGTPAVVAVAETQVLTDAVLAELGLSPERAYYEPFGRNTAPAIALVCHLLLAEGRGEEVVGIFPADHLIEDQESFVAVCRLAASCAAQGQVVTLGIRPSYAATGYGYIESSGEAFGDPQSLADGGELRALQTRGFHEKPDAATAERFVEAGSFFWNAGMFVFKPSVLAAHFERLMPATWEAIRQVKADRSNLAEVYEGIEPESIDYGIMERLEEQVTIPCAIGWSDVGSWDEVARIAPRSEQVFEEDAGNNYVFPFREKIYGLVGVDDLLIVDTADALLVSKKGRSQGVKKLVDRVKEAGRPEATEHVFEHRPWGDFEILRDTPLFKSKVIHVSPGQQLSYQSHRHRAEHWVIVKGHPEVVLDDEVLRPQPGESVYIPLGAKHRIRNPTDELVEFVEVQLGTYFGEDDIVRYEDDYDRT